MSENLQTAQQLAGVTAPAADQVDAIAQPLDSDLSHADLKKRTTHGALISLAAQIVALVLRTGSMVVLARLLDPHDFGLVGMVAAFTGFLALFKDIGLSMATIQRASITEAQTSTLFWVNLVAGGLLAGLAIVAAPILAAFYHEPQLLWVTVVLGMSFIFNGATAQHRAMLQRNMRFTALAIIDSASLILSAAVGIGMAMSGLGYWSLVGATVSQPVGTMFGVWIAARWIPGMPQRRTGIRSMLLFGGTVTLNSLIVYLAYNVDKILLGRFWGAEALGIYGRAYQLINIPTENLNSAIGSVAFSALSRIQNDAQRLRRYFLKGYSLFLSLVMPITMGCALFAEDIVRVFLGDKWHEAVPIFRLMSPTIVVFAMINPLSWLMLSAGHAGRSLKIALFIAPVVILGYVLGLRSGPHGVAAGFSIAMTLLAVPVMIWAKHGTLITHKDALKVIMTPLVSVLLAAGATFAVRGMISHVEATFLRLVVESAVLFGVYLIILLFGLKQKSVYVELLRETGLWPVGKRSKTN